MTKTEIQAIMEESAEGYSREDYSDAAWRGAIKYLASQGFTHEAIVQTLLSKWMRWGHDGIYGRNGKQPTGKSVANFLEENLEPIKDMLFKELNMVATLKDMA
ncbi:unnamed protein product [marine sediment metagenome]|uniref:Uncharacterized protein n=1 Tax=marine sediment metagenome TaxID=412755 RepID=X0RHI0_9ZZZZ